MPDRVLTSPARIAIVAANSGRGFAYEYGSGRGWCKRRLTGMDMPSSDSEKNKVQKMANAIRALAMDAVQKANSGHPGMPMGMADAATVLFTRHLHYDPARPDWPDRDRFVLSAGHGSMLIYALLHLTGYERPTMEDIRNFRQLGSPCAGHPEVDALAGVETTTGPLGQGLAMAVGMAIAEAHLREGFGPDLVDHHTYAIAGDGCLMEGISHETASLAGHLGLGRLIVLFDDNHISIDGDTDLATSDDHLARFAAYGWHTLSVDGHDMEAVDAAITKAKKADRPSLIACRTVIGKGAPGKQGTAATHGAPLGAEEILAARKELDWPYEPFEIPDEIYDAWQTAARARAKKAGDWHARFDKLDTGKKAEFARRMRGDLTEKLGQAIRDHIGNLISNPQAVATRKASAGVLEAVNAALPETIGGSADLTGSNNTKTDSLEILNRDNYAGRYIHYGVREFAMGAAMNGMALHGGVIPYGGTFLVFSDYARPAIRLSALMEQRVIYVMTHDSIGLGEDGPTHQPVEHLASLRVIPGLAVFRPADIVETAECWQLALQRKDGPSLLALSRQKLPPVRTEAGDKNLCADGGYIIRAADRPGVTIVATGSEVATAIKAADALEAEDGTATRVISMPWREKFLKLDAAKRKALLGDGLIVTLEAAATMGWREVAGDSGLVIGLDRFGASAPAEDLFEHFGLTAEGVLSQIRTHLKSRPA